MRRILILALLAGCDGIEPTLYESKQTGFACTIEGGTCELYDRTAEDLAAAVRPHGIEGRKPSLRGVDPDPRGFVALELTSTSVILVDRSVEGWVLQCALIHELGHAYGLGHSEEGIMSKSTLGCARYTYSQAIEEVAALIVLEATP